LKNTKRPSDKLGGGRPRKEKRGKKRGDRHSQKETRRLQTRSRGCMELWGKTHACARSMGGGPRGRKNRGARPAQGEKHCQRGDPERGPRQTGLGHRTKRSSGFWGGSCLWGGGAYKMELRVIKRKRRAAEGRKLRCQTINVIFLKGN